MSFTTFLENEVLDHVFRNAAYTPPSTVYIGLYTSATGAGGTGTEVSGTWGTITHTAVLDAASGGNMLAETALTASKPIASGDVFRFQAGEFDITLT